MPVLAFLTNNITVRYLIINFLHFFTKKMQEIYVNTIILPGIVKTGRIPVYFLFSIIP